MEKHQFKPFDQVLVRDNDSQNWDIDLYSYLRNDDTHQCMSSNWQQCIPYDEETVHLIGTNEPYEKPEPKVFQISNDEGVVIHDLTVTEFEDYIKHIVIDRKARRYFGVKYFG